MKFVLSVFLLALLFSCNQEKSPVEVKYLGELRKIMKENDLSANANLIDFKNIDHLYALGSLENLEGEFTIIDSKPYITHAKEGRNLDNEYTVEHSFDYAAAFMVYAVVEDWISIPIPSTIKTINQLEPFILNKALENGIATNEPFPFLLEGIATTVNWHIVRWDKNDSIHTHEKHIKSGVKDGHLNEPVQIIGFYSNKHHGIFTHHSNNVHLHVRTLDDKLAAHLDHFVLGENIILKLPK